jgi:hypothetical protein
MLPLARPGRSGARVPEVVWVFRYLVVANQTLGGEQLLTAIRDHMLTGPCHFHVLVPATPAGDLDADYLAGVAQAAKQAALPGAEGLDRRQARQLLEDELEEAGHAELGADVSGEVGVADPVEAIRVVLHRWEFDAIILSTLPGRRSRWLEMDLPTRLRRAFKLPVTHVTGSGTPTG